MLRIRWKATLGSQDIQPMITQASNSISAIQAAVGQLFPYNAGGAQQAVTTISWGLAPPEAYRTTAQEHSEMVSLGAAITGNAIWQVNGNGNVVSINGQAIGPANYFTNLPHCGYCTVMLFVLGLPLGGPTRGRYNLAVNLDYRVPLAVKENFNLLARLVNSNVAGDGGWIEIKKMINPFIQNDSASWVLQVGNLFVSNTQVMDNAGNATILDWTDAKNHNVNVNVNHFGQHTLLDTLWKFVYQGLYDNVV